MLDAVRRPSMIAAAVVTAGALAFTTPTMAGGLFDAHNAEKVAGLKPTDLTKTQLFTATKGFDGFDTCVMSTVMKRKFTAPHGGVMTVQGQIGAARDTSIADEGVLVARIVIDGAVASHEVAANLENDGVHDTALNVIGGRKVTKGKHTIKLGVDFSRVSAGQIFGFNQFGGFTLASSNIDQILTDRPKRVKRIRSSVP